MLPLTKRQREILDYLNDFIAQHGYAPSLEEIGRRFSLSSLATVHKHLTNLQEKGFIRRAWNRSRSVELVPTRVGGRAMELPLLGYVAAGRPIEAVASSETIAVPEGLIGRRDSYRSFDEWIAGQPTTLEAAPTHRDDFCSLNYSSGTTGEPKGILHAHKDYPLTSQLWGVDVLGLREDDRTFARELTRRARVAPVPGSSFFSAPGGGQTLVRFAFCKRLDTLREAGERLLRFAGAGG